MASFEEFNRNWSRDMLQVTERAIGVQTLNETAMFMINQIRTRTRAGFGVAKSGGAVSRLKGLSGDYRRHRRSLRRRGQLSRLTTPNKSNLTLTGQMLDSIGFDINNLSKIVYLNFTNNFATRKSEYVSADRPFFNLSRGDIAEIIRDWNDRIQRQIDQTTFR